MLEFSRKLKNDWHGFCCVLRSKNLLKMKLKHEEDDKHEGYNYC